MFVGGVDRRQVESAGNSRAQSLRECPGGTPPRDRPCPQQEQAQSPRDSTHADCEEHHHQGTPHPVRSTTEGQPLSAARAGTVTEGQLLSATPTNAGGAPPPRGNICPRQPQSPRDGTHECPRGAVFVNRLYGDLPASVRDFLTDDSKFKLDTLLSLMNKKRDRSVWKPARCCDFGSSLCRYTRHAPAADTSNSIWSYTGAAEPDEARWSSLRLCNTQAAQLIADLQSVYEICVPPSSRTSDRCGFTAALRLLGARALRRS